MKFRIFFWLMLALAAVRLLLMSITPVFEPSEARYAAISANMARSGDFVVPRFTHDLEYQPFKGKPPLVFQAGGICCKLFGINEFSVRLFPFCSAVLMLAVLFFFVKKRSDADTARLSVVICATSTAFFSAAGFSMTDMSLTCSVASALLLYGLYLENFSIGHAAGVAAFLGAGMMIKGPVALALFGLPVVVDAIVNRHWRGVFNWRWLIVAPIFLVIAVPWFVMVESRAPGSVWYFFYNENFLRFITHDYGDNYGAGREAFRGVAIIWAIIVTLPWIALAPIRQIKWKNFELMAILTIVGFWCLTSRVLIYYLFPVIPLFAAYMALNGNRQRLARFSCWFAGLAIVVLSSALLGGMYFSDKMLGEKTPFVPNANHYAYEFYHGQRPESELAEWREKRDEFFRRMREQEKK